MYCWLIKEKKWFCENRIYICALSVITAVFSLLYFNRFAPDTMGWQLYNAILMENGDMVYKDFFNYLPPGSLLRTIWAYAITNGSILGYRFICILERIFLAILIFKILSRFYKKKNVWFATATGMILTATTVVDQFGDYNQTYKVYLLLGICFGMKFFDSIGRRRTENISLFGFGVCLGMVMLFKHSIGLIAPAAFFVMLLIYCIVEKKIDFFRYAILSILGYMLPITLCIAWLSGNHALLPFIEQVFGSAAAKGDSTTLFLRFWKNIFKPDCLVVFGMFVLGMCLNRIKVLCGNRVIEYCVKITIVFWVLEKYGGYVGSLINSIAETNTWMLFLGIVGCSVLGGCIFLKGRNEKKFERLGVCFVSILFFVAIYSVTCLDAQTLTILYNNSHFFNAKEDLPIFSAYVVVGLLFLTFGYYILKRKLLYSFNYMLMLVGFFSIMYEAGMATGTTGLTYIIACIGIPLLICVGLEVKTSHDVIKNTTILTMCVLLCMLSMVQKYVQPYSWWGWGDPPIDEECQYSIEVPRLEGFRVAKSTKITYEQINKLIIDNSEQDDFVLTFPHMKLFNIISNRMEAPTFVVSYYFDVCPDEYAIMDAEIIRENPPKIVIMNTYDESFWEYNEKAFRGGEYSGQREILQWFAERRNDYTLIGYVNNLEIYSLNDGRPIVYTYFEYDDTDLEISSCEDNIFSIIDIILTQLRVQTKGWEHARSTFLVVILFIGLLGIFLLKGSWFDSATWITVLIGICMKMSPMYSLVYILNLIVYFESIGKKKGSVLDKILVGCMSGQVLSVVFSFAVDFHIIKVVRILLLVMMACIMLYKLINKIIREQRISYKHVLFTMICVGLFFVSQIYFSSEAWWETYVSNTYMSNSDSLKLFSMICFCVWLVGSSMMGIFKNKRVR